MDLTYSNNTNNIGTNRILIRGLVIPAEWDESGKVVAVSIAAFNEKKYFVSANQAGKELLNFIEHEVAVIGSLKVAGAKMFLTISDFFSFGSKSGEVIDG